MSCLFLPLRYRWTRRQTSEPGGPERSTRRCSDSSYQCRKVHLPQCRRKGSHEGVCWIHSPAKTESKVTDEAGPHRLQQLLISNPSNLIWLKRTFCTSCLSLWGNFPVTRLMINWKLLRDLVVDCITPCSLPSPQTIDWLLNVYMSFSFMCDFIWQFLFNNCKSSIVFYE